MLEIQKIKLENSINSELAIAPISLDDFDPIMCGPFSVMISVITMILIVYNMFIARYLVSLKKTMDFLKMASKAKSEFLATVSHEIRTPLPGLSKKILVIYIALSVQLKRCHEPDCSIYCSQRMRKERVC